MRLSNARSSPAVWRAHGVEYRHALSLLLCYGLLSCSLVDLSPCFSLLRNNILRRSSPPRFGKKPILSDFRRFICDNLFVILLCGLLIAFGGIQITDLYRACGVNKL